MLKDWQFWKYKKNVKSPFLSDFETNIEQSVDDFAEQLEKIDNPHTL